MGRTRTKEALEGPFAKEIIKKMKEMGFRKLEEFADYYNIGRTTVYSLVIGRKIGDKYIKPSLDTLTKLSLALEIPVEQLIERLYPEGSFLTKKEVGVPIIGYVGGGPSQLEEIEERTVPVRVKGDARHLAAFKVRGNSMCAGKRPICHGDVIIVNTEDKGHPGAIVVARLENGEYVVKLLKNGALYSTNPEENGPPVIPLDQVAEIVGRVVEVRSRL
ncbi:peptidase S24 [Thermus scotoductus]|jgi:repressor LexA|uniref:Peptidase S24 n=3 Tax=Thermus TaxID=270 RepID=A0A430RVF2_THESC|nr:peptidase S24 [Thermus scotoductus]RTI17431.1 peptidase S24 [Thermus scotoductus]RTI42330.1 peptidase S24 [Thermus scotoductus]